MPFSHKNISINFVYRFLQRSWSWELCIFIWLPKGNLLCRRKRSFAPSRCLGRISSWTRQIYCKVNILMSWYSTNPLPTFFFSPNATVDPPGCGTSSTTPQAKTPLSTSHSQSLSGWLSMAAESLLGMNTWARFLLLPSYILHPLTYSHLPSSIAWSPPTGQLTMRSAPPAPRSPLHILFSLWRISRRNCPSSWPSAAWRSTSTCSPTRTSRQGGHQLPSLPHS